MLSQVMCHFVKECKFCIVENMVNLGLSRAKI